MNKTVSITIIVTSLVVIAVSIIFVFINWISLIAYFSLPVSQHNFKNSKYYIKENDTEYKSINEDYNTDEIIALVNTRANERHYSNPILTDVKKGNLMLVNKYNYLETTYVPNNLVKAAKKRCLNCLMEKNVYEAYEQMATAAEKENLTINIASSYRSYNSQFKLYNNYVAKEGLEHADTHSARPGYSEHQTGLALDLISANDTMYNFGNTKEGAWTKENAHKYGFILRYPENKTFITGYIYEPWHYRYVGTEVATYIYENNITFDEYYAYYLNKGV